MGLTAAQAQGYADLHAALEDPRWAPIVTGAGANAPAGELTPYAGNLTTTKDGQVIADLLVTGKLDIRHDDVQVTNVVARWGGTTRPGRLVTITGRRTQMTDVTVDGAGLVDEVIFGGVGATFLRVDVSGGADGIHARSGSVEDSCYVHHLVRTPGYHADCWQITQSTGCLVRNSIHVAYNDETGDLCNSAFQIGADTGPVANVVIDGCLVAGGNYPFSTNGGKLTGGGTGPGTAQVTVRDSQVIRGLYRYGPVNGGLRDRQDFSGLTFWTPTPPAPDPAPVSWMKQ